MCCRFSAAEQTKPQLWACSSLPQTCPRLQEPCGIQQLQESSHFPGKFWYGYGLHCFFSFYRSCIIRMVLGGLCRHCACCLPGTSCLRSNEPSGHSWAEEPRKGSLGVVVAIIPRMTLILCSVITAGGCRVHREMGCGWLGPAPVVEAAPQNPLSSNLHHPTETRANVRWNPWFGVGD